MLECSFALHPPDEKGKNVHASDALVDSSENIISLLFLEHTISLLYDHSYSRGTSPTYGYLINPMKMRSL